jgi:hypothetical protein
MSNFILVDVRDVGTADYIGENVAPRLPLPVRASGGLRLRSQGNIV